MNTPKVLTTLPAVMLAVPLTLCACGDGDAVEVPTVAPVQASPEVGAITDPIFGNDAYIGRTVTVTAEVTQVITDRSFVLSGDEYGDDSLLVLSAPDIDADRGKKVTVSGVVHKFTYDAYAEDYDLSSPDAYVGFDAEEFLVAGNSPSADASPSD